MSNSETVLCSKEDLARLRKIEIAAMTLDAAMNACREEILSGWNEREWSWAWDDLACALMPALPPEE